MENYKLKKDEILKEAGQLLKQGTSKQETFEILVGKYKSSKAVSDVLKNLPSLQAAKKYGFWNYTLFVLLLFSALFFAMHKPTFIIYVWYGLLMYVVARMAVKYYIYVALLSVITLITLAVLMITTDKFQINWVEIGIICIDAALTLFLSIWLERKLSPKPKEVKELYTDSQGEQKLRVKYEFADV